MALLNITIFQTGDEFLEKLRGRLHGPEDTTGGFQEAPLAYDAVW